MPNLGKWPHHDDGVTMKLPKYPLYNYCVTIECFNAMLKQPLYHYCIAEAAERHFM